MRLCGIADEPFWPRRKILLGLAQFGALQMADFGRAAARSPAAISASVMKNAACRSRGMIWVETGSGMRPSFSATYSSTHGSILAKVPTAPEIAQVAISRRAATRRSRLRANSAQCPASFSPNVRRLGVDAVAAPDGRRVFVLERAPLQRVEQPVEIGEQDVGGLFELHREAGVEHVARRHALVHEARLRADMLGDIGQEGDHVVPCLALDLVDARDLEGALLAHRRAALSGMTPSSACASQA